MVMVNHLLLATRNPGKTRELLVILSGLDVTYHTVSEFPWLEEIEEIGATIEENAFLKARYAFTKTGIPSVADDTGLEVYALGMEPGVRSARYAGESGSYEENNRKLLTALGQNAAADRRARFRCIAAVVSARGEHSTEGICEGSIGLELRGSHGFGYDPLFIPDGYEISFAEMGENQKNVISHRSKAFRAMKRYLIEHNDLLARS